jgi:hypothetical protein
MAMPQLKAWESWSDDGGEGPLDPSMHGDITWRSCREIPDVRPVSGELAAPLIPEVPRNHHRWMMKRANKQSSKKERLCFGPPMPAESVEYHSLGHCYVPLTAPLARTGRPFARGPSRKDPPVETPECMTPAN